VLTKEQNDLLTQTGPGTPGGELMRRYWQPVALSEELPVGGAPVPVRLLGEDLVLFRDEQGQPGLLGIHCSHRGADLSYGRLEDGGLRCIYHGWLYDRNGRCLEQPGEPAGSTFHERIRHPAYPCREAGGIILTYLGAGEAPLLPNYEFLMAPDDRRTSSRAHMDCNYLQGNEGNIDPQHLGILHRINWRREDNGLGAGASTDSLYTDSGPELQVEATDFGLRIFAVRGATDGRRYLRISNFIYPNLSAFPGGGRGEGYSVNWHVPIDDTHHWKFTISFSRDDAFDRNRFRQRSDETLPNYHLTRTRDNRYGQDRNEMDTETWAGVGFNFVVHDKLATETAGEIQDRTQEHTTWSDKAIVMQRLELLKAIGDVQAGEDAPHIARDAAANYFPFLGAVDALIPASEDWRNEWKRHYAAGREAAAPFGTG